MVNIAGTYDFKIDYNLNSLAMFLGFKASYETELFPNLIWKHKHKTVIISKTGKSIITGCKSIVTLNNLLYLFAGKLMEYEYFMN